MASHQVLISVVIAVLWSYQESTMNAEIKSEAAPERKRILLIDDEEDFSCFFVKLNLEKTGRFEILTTTSGSGG